MFFKHTLNNVHLKSRLEEGKKVSSLCCSVSWLVSQESDIPPLSIVLSETIRSIKKVKDETELRRQKTLMWPFKDGMPVD